jgi:Transglycosylase SLT domain
MHSDTLLPTAGATPAGRRRATWRILAIGLIAACLALAGSPVASAATKQDYKNYARAAVGGNATQFGCLDRLWTAESGWNPAAQNPHSTAYGIPQFLNSTWASTGTKKTSNPYRQIDAGLIYIHKRYGTPCGAWSFFSSHHGY